MNSNTWKQRTDRLTYSTEPSIFHKSREKRKKIEQEIKRFTQTNWLKQTLPTKSLPHTELTKPQIETNNQKQQQKIIVQKQQLPKTEKPIDYSLSLKLSESGAGNQTNRNAQRETNILQNQFYQLKQSKILSEHGTDDKANKFWYQFKEIQKQKQHQENLNQIEIESPHNVQDVKNISQKDNAAESENQQIIDPSKSTIKPSLLQSHEETLKYTFANDERQIENSSQYQVQPLNHIKEYDPNSKTIKPNTTIQPTQTPELQQQKQQQIINPNQNIFLAQKNQRNQDQPAIKNNSVDLQCKKQQTIPNNSNDTVKNLDNSSGKFFFTSQFKQYMQNKSNVEQQPNQQQLNETIKSNILDKVFNQSIKQPEFFEYADLDKIKRKNAENKVFDLLELAYEKESIKLIRGVVDQLKVVSEYSKLIKNNKERLLLKYFMHIKLYKQYKTWKQQKKMNAQKFKTQQQHKRLQACFNQWKNLVFEDLNLKLEKVKTYRKAVNSGMCYSIFKEWKMVLFKNKIERQAIKYRVGTIFKGWVDLTRQANRERQKMGIKFYYYNLMKKIFDGWIEGVNNLRSEEQKKYLSYNFNRERLLSKAWRGWARYMEQQEEENDKNYIPIQLTIQHKIDKKKYTTINFKE